MKIGFIGMGFVGGATYELINKNFETVGYDKFKEPYTENKNKLSECSVFFIALPTPMKKDGENDLSYIYEGMNLLKNLQLKEKPIVVIRSTMAPGSTGKLSKEFDEFEFVFNPEFLRERHALEDSKNMNRVVLGCEHDSAFQKIKEIYKTFLPDAKYFQTSFKTSEAIKYAANTFLATQVIMANEFYKISEKSGVSYQDIIEVLDLDERIGKNLKVPGPDGDFGFGGKCFPKDVNALIKYSESLGYDPKFFKEVWESNKRLRNNTDWKDIAGATSENKNF